MLRLRFVRNHVPNWLHLYYRPNPKQWQLDGDKTNCKSFPLPRFLPNSCPFLALSCDLLSRFRLLVQIPSIQTLDKKSTENGQLCTGNTGTRARLRVSPIHHNFLLCVLTAVRQHPPIPEEPLFVL